MTPRTLVVGSAFRNASHYLGRYFTQVSRLKELIEPDGWTVRVIAVEGDSSDSTCEELIHHSRVFGIDVAVCIHNHGRPWFGSTEAPDRMAALSQVGNAILDESSKFLQVTEHEGQLWDLGLLWYVESDLIWSARTVRSLIESLNSIRGCEFDSVSPMPFAADAFYDIWGFRGQDDQRYSPFAPFHADLDNDMNNRLVELHSAGSGLLMRAALVRDKRCRMSTGALVEFCANARAAGYTFAVNPSLRINHP